MTTASDGRPTRGEAPGDDAGEAVTHLLERYGDRLFGLALRLCGHREEAEDLVQEVFLQAYRKWHTFEGRSEPSAWLFTIARHACQRMHRRRSGEPATLEPLDELLPAASPTVVDLEAAGPLRDRLRGEAEATVERALAELPLDFRLPLVLTDVAELSIGETAEVLGLKPNTVKTRVHRARLKLRKALEAGLPQRVVPRTQPQEVCLSMLRAKQEALDRGVELPYSDDALCERCQAVFATLDLGRDACLALGRGELPRPVRQRLEQRLAAA